MTVPDEVWAGAHYVSNGRVPTTCWRAVDARVVLDQPGYLFIEVLYVTMFDGKYVCVPFLDESGYEEAVSRDPEVEDFIATRFEKEFKVGQTPPEQLESMMKVVYSMLQIPTDMLEGKVELWKEK
jgi:hypothetical protein